MVAGAPRLSPSPWATWPSSGKCGAGSQPSGPPAFTPQTWAEGHSHFLFLPFTMRL